ncbi:nickel-type superoxide dismutase maturation protease [Actinomadura scrupuli]|uniref:nickel-type superoxide dismutase maturation protease n=1 Tax=Actinomadura scrupuli TaxID=559629 RepID=UPI003D960A68
MRRPLMAVQVAGESMLPWLRPGDRLLVRPGARIGAGDIVIAGHPLEPGRLIVKRVTHRDADGWWLESDNQRASGRQDSWDFGAVPDRLVVGRAVLRYWPSISASALARRRLR